MTGWRKRKEEPVPSKLSRMFLNCSDEKYTPGYGVTPIIKYLPEGKIIWCPFDTCHSEFVLHLQEAGFQVKYSHINTGQDFLLTSRIVGILLYLIRLSAEKWTFLNAACNWTSRSPC